MARDMNPIPPAPEANIFLMCHLAGHVTNLMFENENCYCKKQHLICSAVNV